MKQSINWIVKQKQQCHHPVYKKNKSIKNTFQFDYLSIMNFNWIEYKKYTLYRNQTVSTNRNDKLWGNKLNNTVSTGDN